MKDDELRKKYDTHGEEGLRDDYHGGGQYQSWKFYNEEFGEILICTHILEVKFCILKVSSHIFNEVHQYYQLYNQFDLQSSVITIPIFTSSVVIYVIDL